MISLKSLLSSFARRIVLAKTALMSVAKDKNRCNFAWATGCDMQVIVTGPLVKVKDQNEGLTNGTMAIEVREFFLIKEMRN